MDRAVKKIINVKTLEYRKLVVETSSNKLLYVDLSDFVDVFCFPVESEWEKVKIGSFGVDLIWQSGFEVHIDQLMPLAFREEDSSQAS